MKSHSTIILNRQKAGISVYPKQQKCLNFSKNQELGGQQSPLVAKYPNC